jgi:hypothetical protein
MLGIPLISAFEGSALWANFPIQVFSFKANFTSTGLKVQLAPLLPYGSYCNEHVWGATVVEESMHVNTMLGKGM